MSEPASRDDLGREEAIFNAAVRLRDLPKRAVYLDWACEDDAALRGRIEKLLASDAGDTFFTRPMAKPALLDSVAPDPAIPSAGAAEAQALGERIGRYRLLQKIGEGGLGLVYMAEQEEPVRRRVALKVIRLGMDTQSVIVRFEAERQALAMMDHPNIAKILDGGVTEAGRPYFVMDLVQGLPIIQFCDEAKLSTRARLDLFREVCSAIQHAHQKGIIHRDIKPSNILVTLHGEKPVPKVIDFGIAKATQQRLTDKTLFTQFQQFLGTPAYVSPEQATLSGLDIDTRSDIYSLGVLLYELLTGKTPFDSKELLQAGLDEMRRTICEKEPARPSTRVSALRGDELTTTAQRRGVEAPKLINLLRGDLDWIVMKCLEKDRARRYETANGLARDVERHLNSEPVLASPPSAMYRFQKLVRRNRVAIAAAATVVAALSMATIISTWQYLGKAKAEREQRRLRQQAQQVAAAEAGMRATADQQLYDALVAQARGTRLARRVGYRDQVLALLRRASTLKVPQRDPTALRREALACMGDFVGLRPTILEVTTNTSRIWGTKLDPTGGTAAFLMTDGRIILIDIPSGRLRGSLRGDHPAQGVCFGREGNKVLSLHYPKYPFEGLSPNQAAMRESLSKSQVWSWVGKPDGEWEVVDKKPVAFAVDIAATSNGIYAVALRASSATLSLVNVDTLATVASIPIPRSKGSHHLPFAISDDGKYWAVGFRPDEERGMGSNAMAEHAIINLYDIQAGQRVQRWEPRMSELTSLTFSSDGKCLGCLSGMGGCIYSVDASERAQQFHEYFSGPERLAFAPDRSVVAVPLWQQGRIRLWDWRKNEDVASLQVADVGPFETGFSPDGRLLFASHDNKIWLYALEARDVKLRLAGHTHAVTGLAFSPDGAHLTSVGKDRALKTWDAASGRLVWENASLPGMGQSLSYSPDGRMIATGGTCGCIWVCDARNGNRLLELMFDAFVWCSEFSHDGRYLAAAGDNGSEGGVHVWEIKSTDDGAGQLTVKAELKWTVSRSGGCANLSFSPDDKALAFCTFSNQPDATVSYVLDSWAFQDQASPRTLLTRVEGGIPQNLSFIGQGRRLIVGCSEAGMPPLRVVDLESGQAAPFFAGGSLSEHPPYHQASHSLSPDESLLAHISDSGLGLDVWDTKNKILLYPLPEETGTVYWMAWSRDARQLAISRSNGDITVWDLRKMAQFLTDLNL
jgi:serine/threonine protein kinase/WD40 repeat protein